MAVRVIQPPEPIVSWAEAKAHLREDSDDEQAYVEGLIAAATAWIDGPAGWLGRCLGPQFLEFTDAAPCSPVVRLPYPPVLEIEAAWVGDDPVPVDHYQAGSPAFSFGSLLTSGEPIRIRYWAGYGKRAKDGEGWTSEAPAPIKQAILLLVGQWFRTRSAVNVGNIVNEMPFAVDALLSPYRRWS